LHICPEHSVVLIDLPVVRFSGVPKAEVAIYWAGLGFGNDMNHLSNHTVIPQDACPT
jgi:hypothetical protein